MAFRHKIQLNLMVICVILCLFHTNAQDAATARWSKINLQFKDVPKMKHVIKRHRSGDAEHWNMTITQERSMSWQNNLISHVMGPMK